MKSSYKNTIIFPFHNEISCLRESIDEITRFAETRPDTEFILVDDGSTDGTAHELDRISVELGKLKNMTVVILPRNIGKGNAVKSGVFISSGEYILFMDGDLAYHPNHLEKFEETLSQYDIAIGSRNISGSTNGFVKKRRRYLGRSFNFLARKIMGLPYLDTQAGIKGFRRDVAYSLFEETIVNDFTFDVELLLKAKRKGFSVKEVAVTVSSTHNYKKSKLKLFGDTLKMFFNLIKIRITAID